MVKHHTNDLPAPIGNEGNSLCTGVSHFTRYGVVLFAAVCIASVLGDTNTYNKYHSSNKYLGGSTSGKYLGGSNYYRNRYQNRYPSVGRYNNQGGMYDDYNDRLGLGCK
mgnify:CR=1 FL=1